MILNRIICRGVDTVYVIHQSSSQRTQLQDVGPHLGLSHYRPTMQPLHLLTQCLLGDCMCLPWRSEAALAVGQPVHLILSYLQTAAGITA